MSSLTSEAFSHSISSGLHQFAFTGMSPANFNKLQRMQNKAVRELTFPKEEPYLTNSNATSLAFDSPASIRYLFFFAYIQNSTFW